MIQQVKNGKHRSEAGGLPVESPIPASRATHASHVPFIDVFGVKVRHKPDEPAPEGVVNTPSEGTHRWSLCWRKHRAAFAPVTSTSSEGYGQHQNGVKNSPPPNNNGHTYPTVRMKATTWTIMLSSRLKYPIGMAMPDDAAQCRCLFDAPPGSKHKSTKPQNHKTTKPQNNPASGEQTGKVGVGWRL